MESGPEPIQEPKPPETSEPTVRVFGIPVASGGSWRYERRAWREKMRAEREAKRAEVGKNYHHYHHYQGGGAMGGLLFLFAGAALLLNALGILPWEFWNAVGPLWPGLLIVLGIQFMLGWSWPARFISFLVALALFASITVYGLLEVGSPLVRYVPPEAIRFVQSIPAFYAR